jgi:hypothetical protein
MAKSSNFTQPQNMSIVIKEVNAVNNLLGVKKQELENFIITFTHTGLFSCLTTTCLATEFSEENSSRLK